MSDQFDRVRKTSPIQHEVNDRGLHIFEASLPKSHKYKLVFTERLKNDYGMDGDLQVFENSKHTNEYYYVQLKSTSDARYIKKGKFLSYSLDLKSAFTLFEAQIPTVLIIVDVRLRNTYWYPIQLEADLLERIEHNLALDSEKLQPIQLHVPIENILKKSSYGAFRKALQETSLRQSKKNILRLKDTGSFSVSLLNLSEIENSILQQEGYIFRFRSEEELPDSGVVFSITRNGRVVDYYPGPDFRPDLLPKTSLTAIFSKKDPSDIAKYQKLKKLRTGIDEPLALSTANISKLVTTIGDRVIDEASPGHSYTLNIAPYSERVRKNLILDNDDRVMLIQAEFAVSQNKLTISSREKQLVSIQIDAVLAENGKGTYTIAPNHEYIHTFADEMKILDFFAAEQISMRIPDDLGFAVKIEGLHVSFNLKDNELYSFKKLLQKIELKTGVPIPYPLPKKISESDVQYVRLINRLLDGGEVKLEELAGYTKLPDDRTPESLIGETFEPISTPAPLFLLGKPYEVEGYTLFTKGIISRASAAKRGGYDIVLKPATWRLQKNTK